MSKRKEIESAVLSVFSTLDKTGLNTRKYVAFFKSMNDAQFKKWIEEFLKNDEENFFLEIIPHKNEPSLTDIEKAAKLLNVPLTERVIFPHLGKIKTKTAVPVGWLMIKRHQQIVSKKNSIANTIKERNQRTGQVTGGSKAARESDMENYALQTIGAKAALKEFMGARSDDLAAKQQMYSKISTEGFVQEKELKGDPNGKVALNTINVLMLAAGLRTNLISNSLVLRSAELKDRVKAK